MASQTNLTIPRSISSPHQFIIGAGLLKRLPEFAKPHGKNIFIISTPSMMNRIKKICMPAIEAAGMKGHVEKFGGECTDAEIKRIGAAANKAQADIIVGIGGGKPLDTAKAVAYYYKKNIILYPTIASSDAPCIALAVIYKEDESFDRYLFLPQNPDIVLADTDILASAPARFFSSGVGDALATYFEARACYTSGGLNLKGCRTSCAGLGMARMCYDFIKENVDMAMDAIRRGVSTTAVDKLIEATIYLSGMGAESGGLAAAHAIHNGMTVIEALHDAQHGEKVAFGLIVQLVLENAPNEEFNEVMQILKSAGLAITLSDLGVKEFHSEEWREVARLACSPDDTMKNMPQKYTPDDVYQAIVAANATAERYKVLLQK